MIALGNDAQTQLIAGGAMVRTEAQCSPDPALFTAQPHQRLLQALRHVCVYGGDRASLLSGILV